MFKDFNLKLAVLSELMEGGHYVVEAERLRSDHGEGAEDYRPIPEVITFYRSITIPDELLATVTKLSPDGGDLAYLNAMNVWDGEDNQFDISSLEGIEKLVNLTEFTPIAMIAEDGIDYTPLLGCPKLKLADMSFASSDAKNEAVEEKLSSRGVEIET